jgi:HK97 family phage prohead protease
MNNRIFLTKKEPDLTQRETLQIKFTPATDDEIRKALGDGTDIPEGYIAGWASTPDLDHYRHRVMPGAFDDSIAEKGLTGPAGIKLLIQHDAGKPAGLIVVLENRNNRLWIEAQLNLKIGYVRDYYEAAKMTGGMNFSVGFYLQDYEFKTDNDDVEYLQINRGELEEVSVVTFPGNAQAQMTFIKSAPEQDGVFETLSELEKALVASGIVKSRNISAMITLTVKKNIKLFQPKETPRVVSDETLDTMQKSISELLALVKT